MEERLAGTHQVPFCFCLFNPIRKNQIVLPSRKARTAGSSYTVQFYEKWLLLNKRGVILSESLSSSVKSIRALKFKIISIIYRLRPKKNMYDDILKYIRVLNNLPHRHVIYSWIVSFYSFKSNFARSHLSQSLKIKRHSANEAPLCKTPQKYYKFCVTKAILFNLIWAKRCLKKRRHLC